MKPSYIPRLPGTDRSTDTGAANPGVVVSIVIEAPPDVVWKEAADLASHAEWMADAKSIVFRSERRSGVGTVMEVMTVIGPLRTTDVMRVTEWVEGRSIGVTHVGAVSGTGRFTLEAEETGTRFTWSEDLCFPWWFGGPIGAWVARPLFRWIWRRNLENLRARLETP